MTLAFLSLFVGLLLSTFVSEDAACVTGGLLVSQGRLTLGAAILACGAGIFLSDLAIIFAGRAAAQGLRFRWVRWLTPSERNLSRAQRWFSQHGGWVVLASRFIPGTRSATCFAAGLLSVPMRKFGLIFLAASAVWTPLAVGAAYYAGRRVPTYAKLGSKHWVLFSLVIISVVAVAYAISTARNWRRRRLLLARWRRLVRWEFWPTWAIYPPVIAYIIWFCLKHRSLTLFTAVNPGIGAGGGLIGESKSEILRGLAAAGDALPPWQLINRGTAADRVAEVIEFMARSALSFPVVLKPDVGARGTGVTIAREHVDVEIALAAEPAPLIAQAYVPGVEFGVFYFRRPSEQRGGIFAVTEKRAVSVFGNGRDTLEHLILADDRAVCLAPFFLKKFELRLSEIPAPDESITLSELGSE